MESKIGRFVLVPVLLVFCVLKGADAFSNLSNQYQIRIAIASGIRELTVYVRGSFTLIDPASGKVLREGRTRKQMRVFGANGDLTVGKYRYETSRVKFILDKDITIASQNTSRRYRGEVEFILDEDNDLIVINSLPIEQYVRGVLYHEVSHRWPLEAIKAQAVAVRSYALYQAKLNKDRPYDVTSDIYSQVYGGRSAERFRTNIAANRTRGEILTYKGEIFPAYFHATCGGHTENVKELWDHDLAPLSGRPCDFCQQAPLYRWRKNYRSADIQQTLNANGYNLGLIKEIRVKDRNESGRVRTLQIIDRQGKVTEISGKKFRILIGPNKIKSNKYTVEMKGYYFDLHGQGWGHGVGMCQWGAYYMARNKFEYNEILEYYYPGTKITDLKAYEARGL